MHNSAGARLPEISTGLPTRAHIFILIWEYGSLDMGTLMKTTIEISDALFDAAKGHARQRGTTLRALVEEGLRTVLDSRPGAAAFTLRDASVEGEGLRSDMREGGWDRIVKAAYEDRGG